MLIGILAFPVYFYCKLLILIILKNKDSCEMFDYLNFCKETVYSRTIFFLFPKKLKKLKQLREDLEIKIRSFVNKYAKDVNPEWDQNRILNFDEKGHQIEKSKESETSKEKTETNIKHNDEFVYLEKRASLRKASKIMNDEINILSQIDSKIEFQEFIGDEKIEEINRDNIKSEVEKKND